jgi:mRNA interferase RelE/StbE
MRVVFLNSFKKDLNTITPIKVKEKVKAVILAIEGAASIKELTHLKKLKGHPNAYRIRIGDYRLGLYIENKQVVLVRFVKRNDIYKVFP